MTQEAIVEAFTPVIHREGDEYWAEIPAMPGCFTAADSLDECRANIVEAAHGWLEARLSWLMGRPARTGDKVPA